MALTEQQRNRRIEFIRALRDMANWYELRPDLPAPAHEPSVCMISYDKEEFLERRRAAGLNEKKFQGDYLTFRQDFLNNGYFMIALERDKVCTKVKTGERVVPAEPEHVIEEYEWVCNDPVLNTEGADNAQ